MDLKDKKDLTFLLEEKKDETKISKVAKFEGNMFVTDRKHRFVLNSKSMTII